MLNCSSSHAHTAQLTSADPAAHEASKEAVLTLQMIMRITAAGATTQQQQQQQQRAVKHPSEESIPGEFWDRNAHPESSGKAQHCDTPCSSCLRSAMRPLSSAAAAALLGAFLLASPLSSLAAVSPTGFETPASGTEASVLAAESAQVEGAAEAEAAASTADGGQTEEETQLETAETQEMNLKDGTSMNSLRGSPRRLMAVAGAGLVLLAGGALANEHVDSIKAGFQSFIHGIKNKPFSWSLYSWRLPKVNENDFLEFRIVAEGLEGVSPSAAAAAAAAAAAGEQQAEGGGAQSTSALPRKRTFVHIVEKPSEALANFLGLGPRERELGFAIKGRSYRAEFGREQSAWEVFAMQKHIPKHPLFFSLIKALRSPHTGNIYLILPRACCDLSQYYRGAPRALDVRIAAAEMAYSLHLLHARGFLHRDVKPPNYFVSQEGHVQLADFEMLWPISLPCPQEEATQTRGFTAPELRRFGAYVPFTIKSDVYALGMSYARLLMRVRRYQRVPNQALFTKLILEMVSNSIPERLDLDGVLKHKYFEGIDWDAIGRGEAPPPCPLATQVMHRLAGIKTRMQQPQQEKEREGKGEGRRPRRGGRDQARATAGEQGDKQPQQVETPEQQQQEQQQEQQEQEQEQQEQQEQQQVEEEQQQQEEEERESESKGPGVAGLEALQEALQESDDFGTPGSGEEPEPQE
ncbi:hypothetical protein Emed_001859 [Eimeria media]